MSRSINGGRPRVRRRAGLGMLAMAVAVAGLAACGASEPFHVLVSGRTGQAVDSVAVFPPTVVATEIGEDVEFVAVPTNEVGEELGATMSWRSTNLTVATVDRSGVATVFAGGQTEILATAGTVTGRAVLTVIPELNPGAP